MLPILPITHTETPSLKGPGGLTINSPRSTAGLKLYKRCGDGRGRKV